MKPDTFHVTVANRLDCLLREDQGGCERQQLHQVLGGQAQVPGQDLRQTPTLPTQPTLPTPTPPPPLPSWTGARQPHPTERGLPLPPALGARAGAARLGRQEGVVERLQGPGLMPIKLVCLNLNSRDTRQQPVPASRPASQANQKAGSKRIYQCTYPVQQCLYIS